MEGKKAFGGVVLALGVAVGGLAAPTALAAAPSDSTTVSESSTASKDSMSTARWSSKARLRHKGWASYNPSTNKVQVRDKACDGLALVAKRRYIFLGHKSAWRTTIAEDHSCEADGRHWERLNVPDRARKVAYRACVWRHDPPHEPCGKVRRASA